MARKTSSYTDYYAECADCGWQSEAANALANSARHHDATGHRVSCEVRRTVLYGYHWNDDEKRGPK